MLTQEEKDANVAAGLNEDGTPKEPPVEKNELTAAEKAEADREAERLRHKEALDKAYAARDAAEKEKNDLLKAAREREQADLIKDGKHAEAAELRASEAEKRAEAAEARAARVERDQAVKDAFSEVVFRNARARETAVNSVIGELIQDDNKAWVHKSGVSITATVKSFVDDEDNDFLLKPKTSVGSGLKDPKAPLETTKAEKKQSEMTTEELITFHKKKLKI
jgi:hypothetical protein